MPGREVSVSMDTGNDKKHVRSFWQKNVMLIFGAVWLVLGLGALAGGAYAFRLNQRYAREGVTVEGVVLTRSVSVSRAGVRTKTPTTHHDVTYRFQTPDGTTHEGADSLDEDLWNSLREQGPVTIQYLASDPSTSRVSDASRDTWLRAVPAASLAASAALLWCPIYGAGSKQPAAIETGRSCCCASRHWA